MVVTVVVIEIFVVKAVGNADKLEDWTFSSNNVAS